MPLGPHAELILLHRQNAAGQHVDPQRLAFLMDQADLLRDAGSGSAAAVKAALDAGVDPLVVDQGGSTLICLAAAVGSSECVELLLARGLDPAQARHDGATALMLAAYAGSLRCVEALIAGSDVQATRHLRRLDALMHACIGGHALVAQALIQAGAATYASDSSGRTPLMLAAAESEAPAALIPLALIDALLPVSHLQALDHGGRAASQLARAVGAEHAANHIEAYELALKERKALGIAARASGPSSRKPAL